MIVLRLLLLLAVS